MFELDCPEMEKGEFHHFGYASRSIERDRIMFQRLGYREEGPPFEDTRQGIRGQFLSGGGPRVELLEDLSGFETVKPWLRASTKFYHIAYEVESLAAVIQHVTPELGRIVVPPAAAVGFNMREVAFVMFRSGLFVEFIQKDLV